MHTRSSGSQPSSSFDHTNLPDQPGAALSGELAPPIKPGPQAGTAPGIPRTVQLRASPRGGAGRVLRPLADVLPKSHWVVSDPPVAATEARAGAAASATGEAHVAAHIDPMTLVAFIGCPKGLPNPPQVHPGKGPLLDSRGCVIGQWWIATQLVDHASESAEYPIVMDVAGRRYCGKGRGLGHACKGDRVPSQKAQAAEDYKRYAEAQPGDPR